MIKLLRDNQGDIYRREQANMQQKSRALELFRKANTDFEKKCEALGWTITVNRQEGSGSYIVFCVTKGKTRHSAAYLYSQSTSIQIYNMLAKSVEVIFIRGLAGYDPENTFSKNCPIQVLPESDFLYVLLLRQLNIATVVIGIIKFSVGCESRVSKV